jgi:putative ABC transport system permease protein
MTLVLGAFQLGLLYAMMAMGVYISFRILNIPDLTVDGSFTLGMAVSVMVTAAGRPFLALFAALLSGAAAGLCTGLLQTRLRIHPILSGILTMTALYSINLFVMGGKSNVSLAGAPTLFSLFQYASGLPANSAKLILLALCAATLTAALAVLFKTRTGLEIRATGDNEEMVRSSSINAMRTKCLGLMTANAYVALAGALLCQYQSFSDVGFGSGMVVVGLASVIIGEAAFGRRGVTIGLISVLLGAAAYQLMIALALKIELLPAYGLKLLSAAIVAVSLSIPVAQNALKRAANAKGGIR